MPTQQLPTHKPPMQELLTYGPPMHQLQQQTHEPPTHQLPKYKPYEPAHAKKRPTHSKRTIAVERVTSPPPKRQKNDNALGSYDGATLHEKVHDAVIEGMIDSGYKSKDLARPKTMAGFVATLVTPWLQL